MKNVLEYLEQTAARHPDKIAVIDEEEHCTYRELEERAKRIGTALADVTEPGRPVAVCMDKSVRSLTALLGIVYAGCFYVFINSEQPAARAEQILETAAVRVILTDCGEDGTIQYDSREIALDPGVTVLGYETAVACEPDADRLQNIRDSALDINPLYCNFTSGSTGVPKGVLVSHRSVIDFINVFPDLFGITEKDVIGNQAPFDFDVSVKDIYSALKTGAQLVLLPRRSFSMISQLMDMLCDNGVTTLIWAVSAMCLAVQFHGFSYRVPTTVNKVLFSGEMLPVRYLNAWKEVLPDAEYVNLYGPTEITCNCTYYRVDRAFGEGEQLPIGTAFPNENVFLLDSEDHPVTEPGVRGEVCVSGTALALGYYRNPEQTAKAFVQNPLNPEYPERIYRTGDLAVLNEHGELCFAGRRDFQIKLMGHRIELEEIETILNSLPELERACCGFDAERKKIVCFYVGEPQPMDLKKRLREDLPSYMIPAELYHMEQLPVTLNGKIDRKKLMQDRDLRKKGKSNGSKHSQSGAAGSRNTVLSA